MNKLIAFTGPIGSGKTTAAKELYAQGFQIIRFAGPLKAMLRVLGLTEEHTDGKLKETPCDILLGRTPRYAMQTLGTEWGRNLIDANLWIAAWIRSVEKNLKLSPIVTDDLRFANEAEAVRHLGGTVIFIDKPNAIISDHPSEQFPFAPDTHIWNSGTLDEFKVTIRGLK